MKTKKVWANFSANVMARLINSASNTSLMYALRVFELAWDIYLNFYVFLKDSIRKFSHSLENGGLRFGLGIVGLGFRFRIATGKHLLLCLLS